MSEMEDLEKFFEELRKLKRTPRQGWVDMRIENPESVADHSFGTALVGMMFSDLENRLLVTFLTLKRKEWELKLSTKRKKWLSKKLCHSCPNN